MMMRFPGGGHWNPARLTIRAIPITAEGHSYEVLIPLYRFGLDVERVTLSEWDTIEKYLPESIENVLAHWDEFRDYLRVFPPDYMLRVCFRDDKEILSFQPIGGDERNGFDTYLRGNAQAIALWIEELLTAFRLFKPGVFCHGGQWHIATGTLTVSGQTMKVAATQASISGDTSVGSLFTNEDGHVCYYLDSIQVKNFCEFRNRIEADLEQWRRVPRVALALDYLMSSYSVRQPASQVVDLFVSLEALLKRAPEETSNQLLKRVANLIGRNRTEGKEAYEAVKRFYAVRCAVAHGAVLTAEHEAALADVAKLRELVRKVFLVATALGMRVGFGPEYYAAADDLSRDRTLKEGVQRDAFRAVAATH